MKKVIAISSIAASYLTFAQFAFAVNVNICPNSATFGSTLCNGDLGGLFGPIINVIFVIAILIALAFLIYGGIRWITSQGDKVKVEGARNMLIAALIGLVIVFLSFFLLNVVTNILFGSSAQNLLKNAIGNGILQGP